LAVRSRALSRRCLIFCLASLYTFALLLSSGGSGNTAPVVATWYGPGFEGAITASGEPFDPADYTAAHRTLPFGTKLIVTYQGTSVVVRVNDRGPYVSGRDIDLSQAAAEHIGLTAVGVATVDLVNADPATPTGPYSADATVEQPAQQESGQDANTEEQYASESPQPADPADEQETAEDQYSDQYASQYVVESREKDQATGSQYDSRSEEPKVSANKQRQQQRQVSPSQPVVQQEAPKNPAVELPIPEPALEAPPPELVAPNSTAERAIRLQRAAPQPAAVQPATVQPTAEQVATVEPVVEREPVAQVEAEERPAVQEAPAPQPAAEEEADDSGDVEIVMLPATGGTSLASLLLGALLVGAGGSILLKRRGR
jgi:rare lipoprotein A